jgi:hypothetical protein
MMLTAAPGKVQVGLTDRSILVSIHHLRRSPSLTQERSIAKRALIPSLEGKILMEQLRPALRSTPLADI